MDGGVAAPGPGADPAPPAGFNTYGSRIRAVSAYDSAKLRHSYSKPGSAGVSRVPASMGHVSPAVSGALMAFNTRCRAAEEERDNWMDKCEGLGRELEKAHQAHKSITGDLEVRATTHGRDYFPPFTFFKHFPPIS